jgi:hypothetical protein
MLDGIQAVSNLPENAGFWCLFSGAVFWRVFSVQNMPSCYMEEDEFYGIDKDHAHPRALELAPEAFFWSCGDELAPFGSDEGDMALREFLYWRKENPTLPVLGDF